MSIETVFYIILLIAATALCIALIIYLKSITHSIKGMQNDIKDLSEGLKPLLTASVELSEKLNDISDKASSQLDVSKEIIYDVRDRVDKILDLEEKVRKGVEEPAMQLVKNLSAVVNGVNTFWNAYTKR
jgi:uncharacterized protein YoxC